MPDIPKGYKQTEVGVIPEDWEVPSLGELLIGSPTYGINAPACPCDSCFPTYLRITDISEDGRFIPESKTSVNHPLAGSYMLSEGDLVFARTGASVGKSYLFDLRDGPLVYAGFLIRIRPDPKKLAPMYLRGFVQSLSYWNWVRTNSMRSGQPGINGRQYASLPIPTPPSKAEQEAIATALGDADALIESLDQLIAKKRQIKQGAMQELLTGKRRLPGFNGKWEVKTLGDVFSFSGGFTASRDQLTHDGYCYLHYGDIHTSAKIFIDVRAEHSSIPKLQVPLAKVSPTSLLDDGDVVFVDASEDDEGTSKHVVVVNPEGVPFISGLHTIVAKARTDELDHGYLRHCFQTTAIKKQFLFYAVGTKVSGISKSNIAKVTMPVPSLPEQSAIADILTDMDAEIVALEQRRDKTRALKQGMMQELLTGRIRLVNTSSDSLAAASQSKGDDGSQSKHNWQINEAVIIAVLVKMFGSEKFPLARKRCTKLTYLLHRHVEGKADGYLKKAAGPYNPATKYKGPELIAQKNGYVKTHNNGTYPGFVVAENIQQAETYFQQWYGNDSLSWLAQFKYKKTDELELLATVDMAMQDLAKAGIPVNLNSVKQVIRDHPEWVAKLAREVFSDSRIDSAICACKLLFAKTPSAS